MSFADRLGRMLVFDIETYRPERNRFRDRRIELSPEDNYITLIGTYDGKNMDFSPVTPLGSTEKEKDAIKWVSRKFRDIQAIVGFNIMKYDIPYLVHKSVKYGTELDISSKKIIDLLWFVPAWLDNTATGQTFSQEYDVGKILSLNKVEKYLLGKPMNPISHDQYFKMYEAEQYEGIKDKLRVDLESTYQFLLSQQIRDTSEWIDNGKIDIKKCIKTCPFRTYLTLSQEHSQGFCPLVSKKVSDEIRLKPVDVIAQPTLWNAVFKAHCVKD